MENKFYELRRKDRELIGDRVIELLNITDYGVLSFGSSLNGYAYGLPISYAYDETSNTLYFHGANEGQKLDEIKEDSKVSFCVVGKTETLSNIFSTKYESIITFGEAFIITEEDEKRRALRLLLHKYSKDYLSEGEEYINKSWNRNTTFKVVVHHITAKARY